MDIESDAEMYDSALVQWWQMIGKVLHGMQVCYIFLVSMVRFYAWYQWLWHGAVSRFHPLVFFHLAGWVAVYTSFCRLSRSVHRGSTHSGHPGGLDVTRFHFSFLASEESRRTQRWRMSHYLSVALSLYPSICPSLAPSIPLVDTYNWTHNQFYSSCLSASPLRVVWSPVSLPKAERLQALTHTCSQALLFITELQTLFDGYYTNL